MTALPSLSNDHSKNTEYQDEQFTECKWANCRQDYIMDTDQKDAQNVASLTTNLPKILLSEWYLRDLGEFLEPLPAMRTT